MDDVNNRAAAKPAGYRWFKVWLTFGALLAVLLLVNSIQNYNFVARRMVVEQVRRELNRHVVAIDRQVREAGDEGKTKLPALVRNLLRERESIESIEVRDRDGVVLARAGEPARAVFPASEIHDRLRNREPLFAIRDGAIVELFPIRLPGPERPIFATMQITASLERATAVFWPVRRNLIINCSAAIALLVSIVVIALRLRQYVQGKQLEQQVAIARKVQQDLLPSAGAASESVRVAADCMPAQVVGGDFYDTFEAAPGRTALVLGDVSGKGIPAALLMGVIHGAVRSSGWADSPKAHEQASRKLNQLLCERASGERYATMFWAYHDERRSTLHYVNAGHCAQLLARRRRGVTEIAALDQGGPVLGLLAGASYEQHAVDVAAGDLLVMFSDGIVEAANADGEEFGEERIRGIVQNTKAAGAPELHAEILRAVRDFTGDVAPQDDLTLMVAQFAGAPALEQQTFEIEEMAGV